MIVREWKEDDARGVDDDRSSLGVRDLQSSFFQHMKVASLFVKVWGNTTKGPGVEHPGREGKTFEERGERIHVVWMRL